MNETIASTYPFPIAAAYRRVFTTVDPSQRMSRLVDAIVTTFDFLARCAICDIYHRWPPPAVHPDLTQQARALTVRPELGGFHHFIRSSYLGYAKKSRLDTFFAPYDALKSFLREGYDDKTFGELISIRNTITKRRAEAARRVAEEDWLTVCEKALTRALGRLEVLGDARLIVPMRVAARDGSITYGVARGAHPEMTLGTGIRFAPGEIPHGPTLYLSPERFVPLVPLVAWAECSCGNPCLGTQRFVAMPQWLKTEDQPPEFYDMLGTHRVENAELSKTFEQFVDSLSADFRYQQDDYLRGHDFRADAYDVVLDAGNPFGDTRNTQRIRVRRIRTGRDGWNPRIKLDYHDQAPPIPDDVFDLRIHDTTRDESIELNDEDREIWKDSFRSFGVRFRTPLAFDEERELAISMFEPGLLGPVKLDASSTRSLEEYYEISVHVPVEMLTVELVLPAGATVDPAAPPTVGYLEDEVTKPRLMEQPTVGRRDDGRTSLRYRVRRPLVGRNLLLRFRFGAFPAVNLDDPMPWYWASHRVHELLSTEPGRTWGLPDVARAVTARCQIGGWTIRDTTDLELPTLARLFLDANPHSTVDAILKWTCETAAMKAEDHLQLTVRCPEGTVIGGLSARRDGADFVLDDIAVDRQYRGSRIGADLWRHLFAWLRGRSVRRLRIEVLPACARAIPWYLSLGARLRSLVPDHFGPGHDALILDLPIMGADPPARGA
jgi:GNAT superfamily N-acetyltransferase